MCKNEINIELLTNMRKNSLKFLPYINFPEKELLNIKNLNKKLELNHQATDSSL